MTAHATHQTITCPNCGQLLPIEALVCPNCNGFVHRDRLQSLSAEALRLEESNPQVASHHWLQALALLPPDAPQYKSIVERLHVLRQVVAEQRQHDHDAIGNGTEGGYGASQLDDRASRAGTVEAPPNRVRSVLLTVGSMLVSLLVYTLFLYPERPLPYRFQFALGFVLLMLVHEMGHVFAVWHYRLSASVPIFVPFMGAVINLRQQPQNAWVEAVVGIGGPLLGTVGAILVFWCAVLFPQYHVLMDIAFFGVLLNLFNLLPVPPLDGGRITAAIGPGVWIVGVVLLVAYFLLDLYLTRQISWILVLILVFAWPRLKQAFKLRNRTLPYYQIPKWATYTMACMYLGLAALLAALFIVIYWGHLRPAPISVG